ncbi:glycine radical domain-containing protein, partial [Enterococcus faecium]
NPSGLGKEQDTRIKNLRNVLDGYFSKEAYHLNVNVFSNDLLRDGMENPMKYPNLTVRVSGYAVKFRDLTRRQE